MIWARLVALFLLLLGCQRDVASTVLAYAPTVAPSPELVADVTRLAETGLKQTPVFNRTPADGEIGIILTAALDWRALAKANREAAAVEKNCYALPRSFSIVCDATIFTERPRSLLGTDPTAEQRTAFARWVIGHELGHLATATAGFDSEPRRRPSRTDLRQQRREYAADCWMVRTVARALPLREQVLLESFAIDVINEHFRRAEPHRPAGVGLIFDYTTLDPYRFTGGGSHPDDILRSIRVLHIAAEQRNDATLRQLMSPLVRKLVPDPLWTGSGPCGLS
jgi:hypothetical protein